MFLSVANRDKRAIVYPAKRLADLGFRLLATRGTAGVLDRAGVPVTRVEKVSEAEGTPEARSIVDLIREGSVDMVVNTPFGRGPRTDGWLIRTAASQAGIPCVTTLPGRDGRAAGDRGAPGGPGSPRSLQELHERTRGEATVQPRLPIGSLEREAAS